MIKPPCSHADDMQNAVMGAAAQYCWCRLLPDEAATHLKRASCSETTYACVCSNRIQPCNFAHAWRPLNSRHQCQPYPNASCHADSNYPCTNPHVQAPQTPAVPDSFDSHPSAYSNPRSNSNSSAPVLQFSTQAPSVTLVLVLALVLVPHFAPIVLMYCCNQWAQSEMSCDAGADNCQ